MIQLLCMKPGVPEICLSDSDSEPIPPSPKCQIPSRTRLKLGKSSGECNGECE